MSRRLNNQLFSVIGPGYVPDHPAECEGGIAARRRGPSSIRRPGMVLCILAVLGALIGGTFVIADEVIAAIRGTQSYSAFQRPVSPISLPVVMPPEPVRW